MARVEDPGVAGANLTAEQLADIAAREQEVARLEVDGKVSEHAHLPFADRPDARGDS